MNVTNRLCGRNWFIEAQNGDRLDLVRGREYATSATVTDGKVMVFSRFWVKAPIEIFYDQGSVEERDAH